MMMLMMLIMMNDSDDDCVSDDSDVDDNYVWKNITLETALELENPRSSWVCKRSWILRVGIGLSQLSLILVLMKILDKNTR